MATATLPSLPVSLPIKATVKPVWAPITTAVAEYNLDDDPELVAWGWHNASQGYAATKELLQKGVKFHCHGSQQWCLSIGAVQAIKESGSAFPRCCHHWFRWPTRRHCPIPPPFQCTCSIGLNGEKALTLMVNHLKGLTPLESAKFLPGWWNANPVAVFRKWSLQQELESQL